MRFAPYVIALCTIAVLYTDMCFLPTPLIGRIPAGWEKARKIKDMRVVNGKRQWLVAWDGADKNGNAWPDTWEPTCCVSDRLRRDFIEHGAARARRCIQVDTLPLDTLVQRSISKAAMNMSGESFGMVHEYPLNELSLHDVAEYYIKDVADKYNLTIESVYNPKTKCTVVEVRLREQEKIGEFLAFESFMPASRGVKSIRYALGRKSNTDLEAVAVVYLRYVDTKHAPGCVAFSVEFHTVKINGKTGSLTPPCTSSIVFLLVTRKVSY